MIYAGTGHRPPKLGGYDNMPKLVEFAIEAVNDREDLEEIITGMALGWDMALAEAAWALEIPFIAAIPFKGQEGRWPIMLQKRYHELVERASHVHVVCPQYNKGVFHRRNKWMVDNGDMVLALWNGDRAGGTYNCVEYAKRTKTPIRNEWEAWRKFNGQV